MGVRVGIAVGIGRGEKELALSPIQSKRWGMSTKRQKMVGTRFMAELRNVISDDFDGNMSELSRQSKVPSGTLGHYLSTHRYPRVDVLDRMLRCLGKESKARLLEAYLLDLTPPSARGQVVVRGSQDPALEPRDPADGDPDGEGVGVEGLIRSHRRHHLGGDGGRRTDHSSITSTPVGAVVMVTL